MTTDNAAELGKAIERGEDTITIEGDLARKIIRIKGTGKIAWALAGGCIAVAIVAVLSSPAAPVAGPAGLILETTALAAGGAGAIGVLGVSATVTAISIGVGAKSKNAINKLRNNYTLTKINARRIVLKKK